MLYCNKCDMFLDLFSCNYRSLYDLDPDVIMCNDSIPFPILIMTDSCPSFHNLPFSFQVILFLSKDFWLSLILNFKLFGLMSKTTFFFF